MTTFPPTAALDAFHGPHPEPPTERRIEDARVAFLNAAPRFAADPAGAERVFLMLLRGLQHEHTPGPTAERPNP